ncbi:hypothetical protein JCM11491_002705 [Sporobolomyces phaffii]
MEPTVTARIAAPSNAEPKSGGPRLTLARRVSPTTGYTFPSLYSFPPFFTKQPNPSTWAHQRDQWVRLVLSWSRHTKTSLISLSQPALDASELFTHRELNRALPLAVVTEVLKFMAASKPPAAEFVSQAACYVYWKTPAEWADAIYSWVRATGQQGAILTFYELTESDPSLEFYTLPEALLRKVLDVLQRQGKCQVLRGTLGEDGDGVKFV